MPIHDRHLRRTPYEHALPDPAFPERRFVAIAREARERGIALTDPGAFALLEQASEALEELRRPSEDADTLPLHASFLFHAFHHHGAGTPALLVRTAVVRWLVEGEGSGADGAGDGSEVARGPAEPHGAGAPAGEGLPAGAYVQLPLHLVWTPPAAPESVPQSLDGFFWTTPGDGTVHVLAVGGLRSERPGFTVLPVPAAPLDDLRSWRSMAMRTDGSPDFASDLPGAELEGLYEVRTAGELLKLAARLDAFLRLRPPSAAPGGSIVTLDQEDRDAS